MIENFDEFETGVVIGVRFRPYFPIIDSFGKIIDYILNSRPSIFSSRFPAVGEPSSHERILVNEDTDDKFTIDITNMIVNITYKESDGFKKSDLASVINDFDHIILKGILNELRITNIHRIGLVKKFTIKDEALVHALLSNILNKSFSDINQIDLQFVKKILLSSSMVKKSENNYDNAIVTIKKEAKLDEIYISLDYQRFFEPNLNSASKINLHELEDLSNLYIKDNLVSWVNQSSSKED